MNGTLGARGEEIIGPEVVHEFWFGGVTAENYPLDNAMVRWFRAAPDFDDLIRSRFAASIRRASAGEYDGWCASARGRTSLVVLLDQFPRNAFRGTPNAFAFDDRARGVCREGVAIAHGRALTPVERHFLYLPLLHSETLADQELSVTLYEQLRHEAPESQADYFQAVVDAARRYHAVIERFGRFPHRNAALGRVSTAEEIDFMTNSTPRWANGPRAG